MQKTNNTKKTLSIILCLVMILSALPLTAVEGFALTSGDWEYTVSNNEATITKYNGSANVLSIPSTFGNYSVISIGNNAFSRCISLTSVIIPDSITKIGESAFWGCTSLISVEIPNNVTHINRGTFSGCSSLTSVTIHNNIKTIGASAFSRCTSLENITIPNSVTSIGEMAFSGCESLESITIPDSVTGIGEMAFYHCTSLTSIIIPDSVTSIMSSTFEGCSSLTSVIIPEGVTNIWGNAFFGCTSLQSITIPESVSGIEYKAFDGCTNLSKLTVIFNNNGSYSSINNYITNVIIPDSFTSIKNYAFSNFTSLEGITIPNSVTGIGMLAFSNCTSLENITIPESVTSIGYQAFSGCPSITIHCFSGSYAERYAISNSINYELISIEATSVSLESSEIQLDKGSTYQLVLNIEPINCTESVSYKSSNNNVATVNEQGLVTATGCGTAIIKVTVGNKTVSCRITVVEAIQQVTGVSLNCSSVSLDALEVYQLIATVYPSDAYNQEVIWSSSDDNIATVDQNGTVTAMKKGTATITVTSTDGSNKSASCTVTVNNNVYIVSDYEDLESPHNYENNCSDCWVYENPNASRFVITFDEQTNFEEEFDFLYIYDGYLNQIGCYTGNQLAGKAVTVEDSKVIIKLVTDDSGTEWGFKVSSAFSVGLGDINNDGEITVDDYAVIKSCFNSSELSAEQTIAADINSDGAVDAFDLFYIDKLVNKLDLYKFEYSTVSGNNVQITGVKGMTARIDIPATIDGHNVTAIYNYAFKNNTDVKEVKISSGLTSVKYGAFLNCTSLETVELPNTITSIGTYAFKGCSSLTKITIPASVTSIQATSFTDCPNITIYGTAGSYAETYANNNSIPFVAI